MRNEEISTEIPMGVPENPFILTLRHIKDMFNRFQEFNRLGIKFLVTWRKEMAPLVTVTMGVAGKSTQFDEFNFAASEMTWKELVCAELGISSSDFYTMFGGYKPDFYGLARFIRHSFSHVGQYNYMKRQPASVVSCFTTDKSLFNLL
jgi:hypothetical protein